MSETAPVFVPLLDELEAARAAATPGAWQYDPSEGDTIWDADEKRPSIIALTRDPYGHCEADAACIVAEHNSVPKLTAALRAVLELADELDRDMRRYDYDGPYTLGHGVRVGLENTAARLRAAVASPLGEASR